MYLSFPDRTISGGGGKANGRTEKNGIFAPQIGISPKKK